MKIPKKLIIGDSEWTIKFVRFIAKNTLGFCDSEKQEIEIVTRLSPRERLITFCHELIHAHEDEYGFELDHDIVELLACAITDLIINNLHPYP